MRSVLGAALLWLTSTAVQAQISSDFTAPTLVFRLTVQNPKSTPIHLVKVGVSSKPTGRFTCASEGEALRSLADYPIHFHVTKPLTLIKADPVLRVPPKSSVIFTISLYPNATGACGYWYSEVRAIAEFDDRNRLTTRPERIDADQVEALLRRIPARDDVLTAAKHRDPAMRIQAINLLADAQIDKITAEAVLRSKLSDPIREVRTTAYKQIANMIIDDLRPDLVARLDHVPKNQNREDPDAYSAELAELSHALVALGAREAADKILALITNPEFRYFNLVQLDKFRSPEMLSKLTDLLKRNISWAAVKDEPPYRGGPEFNRRYGVLLETLIEYRDFETVDFLKEIMSDQNNYRATNLILAKLLRFIDRDKLVQDPFIWAFHEVALSYVADRLDREHENLKETALLLAIRTAKSKEETEKLLVVGFRAPSIDVRLKAAEEAASLQLESFVSEVQAAAAVAPPHLKRRFCEAAKGLGASCSK